MSEEIGRHKGAVETLLHEKKELSRILQIVNSQLQKHLQALEEEGIDTDKFIEQLQEKNNQQAQQKRQRQQKKRKQQSQQKDREEEETDVSDEEVDDFLEGDNNPGTQDFNPNR